MDASDLLKRYKAGVGFRPDDILMPREGASPATFDAIDSLVVVLNQSLLAPHKYTVIGERPNPRTPADQFVKFEINGHDWQKVGRA